MRFLVLLMAAASFLQAQAADDPRTAKGFEHFYNLQYDDSIAEFRRLVAAEPSNPNFHNHVAQAVLYREMYRGGALESELVSGTNPFINREKLTTTPEAQKEFDSHLNNALQIAQERLAKNANDVGALYAQGVSHGLRANYNFLVKKAWMDALKDATAARKAHNRVVELDPKFTDARLVEGVHDYVVGSLPWHWKILGFLGGFRGDREEGIQTLELVASKGRTNQTDAQVLLAAIYRREKKADRAIALLQGLVTRFPRNFLFRLEMVQMYSDLGDKAKALDVLAQVEDLKRSNAPGFAALPMEKVHYYRGNLLFWYGDFDQAIEEMTKATRRSADLDRHTSVMAWMRLGQLQDLRGKRSAAISAYKQAIAVAPYSDAGKESKQYLSSPYRRS